MDRKITEEELRANDGQEGRPAFIAYKGKVYDVSASKMWRGGVHVRRHHAGQDLTADFPAAPHADNESLLERVTLVGDLVMTEAGQLQKELPALLSWFLDRHPHPISVHFPIAYVVAVALFLVLYLLTNNASFEVSAYYLLWGGVGISPIASLMGATSWWYNYQRKLNWKFLGKIVLAVVLMVLGAIALTLRTADPTALVNRTSAGWTYVVVVAAMVVVVSGLGWIGDKIMYGK